MPPKTQQLQVRVTTSEKLLLKRRAAAAGVDVSTYVLRRVLTPAEARVDELLAALAEERDTRDSLAAFGRLLAGLESAAFRDVVAHLEVGKLTSFLQNYVAAMVELRAGQLGLAAPKWTRQVDPIDEPYFAGAVPELRPYLLQSAPLVFKRRNLFVDASVGDHL